MHMVFGILSLLSCIEELLYILVNNVTNMDKI